MKKNKQAEAFAKLLKNLNPAQRQAVEQIEGPVLVVAGPGTGKTHMLTARIGQILQQTDALPENILCLTFTDAAAYTMRKRLLSIIGPAAHRVSIHTFHAFCYGILRDHPQYFNYKEWQLISDLERIEIIQQILDTLPSDNPLKSRYADPYALVPLLGKLFKIMKEERWSVTYALQQAKAYADSLLQRPAFYYQRNTKTHKKNDLKTEKYEQELERIQRFEAAVKCYENYAKKLQERGLIEYADMVLLVLEAFEQHPILLLSQQEKYLYFLVDEYQDTNSAQNQLLLQLINYWDVPNVLIVGDDDQSIYEFQGARLKNLMDFYEQYKTQLHTTVLTQNYRSTAPILRAAGKLIQHNKLRLLQQISQLKLDKTLTPSRNDLPQPQPSVKVLAFETDLHEEAWLITQLKKLKKQEYPLEHCAVIYARHRQSERLQMLLAKAGIPFRTRRQSNALDHPAVRIWRKLLEWLLLESQQPSSGEHLIYDLLQAPFQNLPPKALLKLALYRLKHENPPPWRLLIGSEKHLAEAGLDAKEQTAFRQIDDRLSTLLEQVQIQTLTSLLEHSLQYSGLLAYCMKHPQRDDLLNALYAFADFAHRRALRKPRMNLHDFLEQLNLMDRHRLNIPMLQETATGGIQLLTAHASKGLEFNKVFLFGCTKQAWNQKGSGGASLKIPDTLTLSSEEEDREEARRRLFYVAMTRARNELYISFAKNNPEGKSQAETPFINELEETAEVLQPAPAPEALHHVRDLFLQKQQAPSLPESEASLHQQFLPGFKLSISALNTYLSCPLAFYYRFLLKLPAFTSLSARYGQAMHYALYRFFRERMKDNPKTIPTAELLLSFFEQGMEKHRPFAPEKQWKHQLEKGQKNLLQYYNRFASSWPEKSELELGIHSVEVEGIPMKGIIDRVDWIDRKTTVLVDYKTGKFRKSDVQPPSDKKPEGGKYWRQLIFYKLLYDNSPGHGWRKITGGQLSYLEPDGFGRFHSESIDLREEDVQNFLPLLHKTYEAILAGAFSEGCNQASCPYCNFAKDRRLLFDLPDRESESLDDGTT